eukprot:3125069-Amphidinium_carterae.2
MPLGYECSCIAKAAGDCFAPPVADLCKQARSSEGHVRGGLGGNSRSPLTSCDIALTCGRKSERLSLLMCGPLTSTCRVAPDLCWKDIVSDVSRMSFGNLASRKKVGLIGNLRPFLLELGVLITLGAQTSFFQSQKNLCASRLKAQIKSTMLCFAFKDAHVYDL